MAIKQWHVDHWTVDFADGLQTTVEGTGHRQNLSLTHVYAAGTYEPLVVATIMGTAQAAVIDSYGWPELIQRRFVVEVGNRASVAATTSTPIYTPPLVRLGVAPTLTGSGTEPEQVSFENVQVLRGHLFDFALRPQILREAELRLDGAFDSYGHSTFTAWTYLGPDSAGGVSATRPGVEHPASDVLRLQWDAPDRLNGPFSSPYQVPMLLVFDSGFPDGHHQYFVVEASFYVTVGYAALSG
jgi:hypothetical protein